jgi:hypothetical protein
MTDTELKHRLTADVEDIEAPPDLLERVRTGGARRVRRRGLTVVGASTPTVAVIAAGVVGVPALRDRAVQPPVATATPWVDPIKPAPDDDFAFLMKGDTRGDLAGNQSYLDEVLATWQATQRSQAGMPADPIGGNVSASLRGEPRIYWAGNTPAGRVALVLQHYLTPNPDPHTKYAYTGIHTLIAVISDNEQGRPQMGSTQFQHTEKQEPFFVVTKNATNVLVAVDMGRRIGWGVDPQHATPLRFEDGVAAVVVPPNIADRVITWSLRSR